MKLFQRTIYIVYIYCLAYPSLNFGVNYWYQRLITMINILNNFLKIKINEPIAFQISITVGVKTHLSSSLAALASKTIIIWQLLGRKQFLLVFFFLT